MNREAFLKFLIDSSYPNVKVFSEHIGLPYTTVRTILEKGVGNARVDNVIKICEGLGISPEKLSPDLRLNTTIAETLSIMIKLDSLRQKNVQEYTKQQLNEQNNNIITN